MVLQVEQYRLNFLVVPFLIKHPTLNLLHVMREITILILLPPMHPQYNRSHVYCSREMACLDKAGFLGWSCLGVEFVKVVDYRRSDAGTLGNGLVVRLPFLGVLPFGSEEREVESRG